MLSYDRWKPQPARWPAWILLAGVGLGIATFE